MDCLPQRHQAGVYKAYHHYRGGRGGLYHRRYRKAGEKSCSFSAGQAAQQRLQALPGPFFQPFAHDMHAEQEQAQPANQGQYIKKSHFFSPFSFFLPIAV